MSPTDRLYTIRDFRLASGAIMPEATIAYVTQGRLAPHGRNAILLTHGYTSSHHFADGEGASEGSWSALVGPGKPVDTDHYFVVAPNMLGSSYGSTGPASRNPATGRPYGPDFPDITLSDIVAQQHALLRDLGVEHLVAVIGPSYGGFQAFQWAVDFPDFMDGVAPIVTAPHPPVDNSSLEGLIAFLAQDPAWNGGDFYDRPGSMVGTMQKLRINTLRNYGLEADLATRFPDKQARDAEIARIAGEWARTFDPNSMIALRKAYMRFDVRPGFPRIKARMLFVLSRTDALFPPSIAPAVMDGLRAAGVRAEYFKIDSDRGHLASGLDAGKWAGRLRAFLDELPRPA
jgi:homoserine O-acetyltransferase